MEAAVQRSIGVGTLKLTDLWVKVYRPIVVGY